MVQIKIFVDGACASNGKNNARAGIGIHFPDKEFLDISEKYVSNKVTNQRAELYAIYRAINLITSTIEFDKLIIYSDSKYSINCLTTWILKWEKNNWIGSKQKKVLNFDLIKPSYALLCQYKKKIMFKHVKAHTDKMDYESIGNRMADNLAKNSIDN